MRRQLRTHDRRRHGGLRLLLRNGTAPPAHEGLVAPDCQASSFLMASPNTVDR